jgi:chemotaxis protein histidine kinase CheA
MMDDEKSKKKSKAATGTRGAAKKPAAKKTAAKKAAAKKPVAKKAAAKKPAAKKTAAKKTAAKKPAAKKTAAKKPAAKKPAAKKPAAKKPAAKKPAAKKPAAKKPAARKTPQRKAPKAPKTTAPAEVKQLVFAGGGAVSFSAGDDDETPGSSALPKASSPDLLSFAQTENLWQDLSDDEKRDAVVALLEQTANFGVADKPEGRHQAYGDLIAPGEDKAMRQALLQKITSNSSCGLLVRSVWRFLGAKTPLLDPPYKPGSVITNILKYASQTKGANTEAKDIDPDTFDPKAGDVLYIVSPDGAHQHIFTVTKVDGDTIRSIDGGQISKVVDDGGCNSIQPRERTLNRATLSFEDGKKIRNWIDVTLLPFTEPMVELTKGMSDDDVA